ncbi:unnamed protein product [Rotaria socialis]|uniref:Uncharacterized protein n=1 Tax=Rotaria socialis TaxID=392032 RepID=A0A818HQW7_9BILA|nr:unnamed protein product [Rotaria socialis]CAF4627468.1 unnamed protein product [Rotaria socialis]
MASTTTALKLHIDMTAQCFRSFIKQQLTEEVATFICEELLFLVPIAFTSVNNLEELKMNIARRYEKISQNSKSIFYYTNAQDKLEILPMPLAMIDKIRQDVHNLMNKKQKRKHFDSTTSDSGDTRVIHPNKRTTEANDLSSYKYRKRSYRKSNHERHEWSFSSDEDYYVPGSAEILTMSNSVDSLNYQFYTLTRLDHFCVTHLKLQLPVQIRKFQHNAELELSLHRENLYQFFRYIRNNAEFLKIIEDCAQQCLSIGDIHEHITRLVHQLKVIKKTSGFTPYRFIEE